MSLPILVPLIFGEVLFDEFDDGSRILGGAPFNVAWHLQGFGLFPVLLSRVGQDKAGQQVVQCMQQWGMCQDAMQLDDEYPTGRVTVKLVDGQPQFEICHPVAYDFIQDDEITEILSSVSPGLLYHGSLAARSDISSQALKHIKQHDLPCFVDINLRDPWWSHEMVAELVDGASWLKLNDEELHYLSSNKQDGLRAQAEAFLEKHGLHTLIVTRGAKGAWMFEREKFYASEPAIVNDMKDPVGAGDAFSAVCLLGIVRDWPIECWLERASIFASAVCEQRGATSQDISLYKDFLKRWKNE